MKDGNRAVKPSNMITRRRAWSRPECAASLAAALVTAGCTWSSQIGSGRTYYFSDCQPGAAASCTPGNDWNSGSSEKSPKRTLGSVDINSLPAGSRLLLARGGAWTVGMTRLDNPRVTPDKPLVIDAYGTGDKPLIRASNLRSAMFVFGEYNNTTNDGGYTLRNLKLDGMGSSDWGFFLIHNLRNVTLEDLEITGFHIGIHSQARGPHGVTQVVIRNNNISRNRGMGILGQFSNSIIENNLFEANNFGGSGFDHAIYLSGNAAGGRNNIVRNNVLRHNSVVKGVCTGGNFTMHGQMDGMLIEGNTIEQPAAALGCWGISITSAYDTPEWFRNFVVRNNTLINLGGCGVCANAAPGIVVENNRFINTTTSYHTGISIRGNVGPGDAEDRDAIVRHNVGCFPTSAPGQSVASVVSPGGQVSDNVEYRGAAGSTDICAR